MTDTLEHEQFVVRLIPVPLCVSGLSLYFIERLDMVSRK